jgi:hypothetical protein
MVRHYARSVGTLPNKGNNGTVLQGAFKGESPQKTDKTDKKLNHLSFQSTEQQHIPDLVQAFSQENGGF